VNRPLTPARGFHNYFGPQATRYKEYRPRYPEALFHYLAVSGGGTRLAWDCATGNGQAAVRLAERFARVIATDPSDEMIAQAIPHPRVTYSVAKYASGLPDRSTNLVTVAQALHWFDLPRFWSEVRRVARPGGLFVAWTYGVPFLDDPAVTVSLRHFHDDEVGPFWPIERGHVAAGYRTLDIPFERLDAPALQLDASWTFEQMTGYLQTWSATRRYIKAKGVDPVAPFMAGLRGWWGERRHVHWPLTILAARVA
jgi:SAM-dependent methyltransferase